MSLKSVHVDPFLSELFPSSWSIKKLLTSNMAIFMCYSFRRTRHRYRKERWIHHFLQLPVHASWVHLYILLSKFLFWIVSALSVHREESSWTVSGMLHLHERHRQVPQICFSNSFRCHLLEVRQLAMMPMQRVLVSLGILGLILPVPSFMQNAHLLCRWVWFFSFKHHLIIKKDLLYFKTVA